MANKRSGACGRPRRPLLTILLRCAPTPSSWSGITIRLRARLMPGSASFCNGPAPQPSSAPQWRNAWPYWTFWPETGKLRRAISGIIPRRAAKILALPPLRTAAAPNYIEIPGPLRSFARMAALSPDLTPNDLLPALARNIITNGYRATTANEALEQTEYLKLVIRYLSQARELERLAGPSKTLRIDMCESPATADLLRLIGFRMRGGCGSDLVLETVNASRAFLTTDSGFPLAELELALRTNRPFTLDYQPTRVPILYGRDYWQPPAKDKQDKTGQKPGRVYRLLPGRSVPVPAVCGPVQAGCGDRRATAPGVPGGAAQDLRARPGFLRRHVPDPRRQSRGSGRRTQRERMGRPERRHQPG